MRRTTWGGLLGLAIVSIAATGIADPHVTIPLGPRRQPPPPAPPPPAARHAVISLARNVQDPVNPAHLQLLRARAPQKCGPREVAPGVWVKIDCHPYTPVLNAKPFIVSTARAQMLRSGRLRLGASYGPTDADGLPRDVDHRRDGTEGPVKNQEYTSMCTGFSLSGAMDNAILRLGASDVTSPTHIWAHYGEASMASAAQGNLNKTISTWATWPFSPKEGCELSRFDDDCGDHYGVQTNSADGDPKIQRELSQAEQGGRYKITSIERLSIPAQPGDVAAVLATGADLWVAFHLDVSHWGYRALQSNDNVIPDWSDYDGGHAVLLAGYRTRPDGTKQFLVHNSWGTDWGDGGYAWVSEAMVKRFMHYAYKIKVEPVGAPPPQPLTDDDCNSDELVDSVTGKCAAECADGSRPSNGQCPSGGGSAPAAPTTQCPAGFQPSNGRCIMPFHFGHP